MIEVVFFDLGDTLVETGVGWVAGAPEALAEPRARGIPIGLISNTGSLSRSEVKQLLPPDFKFEDFIDELVLLSSEVGLKKPDPKIFELAIERARVEPCSVLFCGEDRVETLAAQMAGMRSARVLTSPRADLAKLVPDLVESGLLN